MARLTKRQLLGRVESAFKESGRNFLFLSAHGEHPAVYRVFRDGGQSVTVRVYIWNVSHGGGSVRAPNEFRIQVTGIDQFQRVGNERTLILGWWDEVGAFAGFDYRRHSGPLGASPSMQIGGDAMRHSHVNGFAPYRKETGEIAIAFRPDFMGTYIENLESLHDLGAAADFAVLEKVAADPEGVEDAEIAATASSPARQHVIVTTKKALRDIGFRQRVLTAYSHRCAMCGIQLNLLDAAHILPVNVDGSTDETCNGIALCALHHRAYDRSLVSFDEGFKIIVSGPLVEELKDMRRADGLERFMDHLRPMIDLPPDRRDRPAAAYVAKANSLRGW